MLSTKEDAQIEAWIINSQGGKRLAEHQTRYKTSKFGYPMVETYLECKQGHQFKILLRRLSKDIQKRGIEVYLTIDGRRTSFAWKKGKKTEEVVYLPIVREGKSYLCEMEFKALDTTDQMEDVEISGEALDRLGRIEIELQVGNHSVTTPSGFGVVEKEIGKVHEESIKLGSVVGLKEVAPSGPAKWFAFTPDEENPILCRFVWQYCTREKLIALKIIDDYNAIALDNVRQGDKQDGYKDGDDDSFQIHEDPRIQRELEREKEEQDKIAAHEAQQAALQAELLAKQKAFEQLQLKLLTEEKEKKGAEMKKKDVKRQARRGATTDFGTSRDMAIDLTALDDEY